MRIDRLIAMANDIGGFFGADPDQVAAAANIASHLRRFWDPRMRRQIVEHFHQGGAGLAPIVKDAVALIAAETPTHV